MSMTNKATIRDVDVSGKKVLVRCDFNVPMKDGVITDDKRIEAALPTIQYLLEQGAAVILCSHLGRPKNGFEAKYSLAPVATRLSELLGCPVTLAGAVGNGLAAAAAATLAPRQVLLLENVRFEAGETKNDPALSKSFAELAQLFVNDAFGSAHRAHCSTTGVAAYLPAVSGFLIQKELDILGEALANPKRPMVAILGGAKVSDKIGVIESLLDKADTVLIGGGMAYTFFAAQGYSVGTSLCEVDKIELAKELLQKAKEKGTQLLLPTDSVVADKFDSEASYKTVPSNSIPDGWMGVDIGPEAQAQYCKIIAEAATVINNGPMGVFEFANFATGTRAVVQAMAESKAITIIGGGDSAAAAAQMGFEEKITHISTGGGASLELMEGLELPGIACLNEKR